MSDADPTATNSDLKNDVFLDGSFVGEVDLLLISCETKGNHCQRVFSWSRLDCEMACLVGDYRQGGFFFGFKSDSSFGDGCAGGVCHMTGENHIPEWIKRLSV